MIVLAMHHRYGNILSASELVCGAWLHAGLTPRGMKRARMCSSVRAGMPTRKAKSSAWQLTRHACWHVTHNDIPGFTPWHLWDERRGASPIYNASINSCTSCDRRGIADRQREKLLCRQIQTKWQSVLMTNMCVCGIDACCQQVYMTVQPSCDFAGLQGMAEDCT